MLNHIHSHSKLSALSIVYDGAPLSEGKGTYGFSHLIEHLMCKAIYPMINELSRYGIEWNGTTTENSVYFEFVGLDNRLKKYRRDIISAVTSFGPINEEDLEIEKDVVIEEMQDAYGDQATSHIDHLFRMMFGFYLYGSSSCIRRASLGKISKFFNLNFKKPTRIISISRSRPLQLPKSLKFRTYSPTYELQQIMDKDFAIEKISDFKGRSSIIMVSPIVTGNIALNKFICHMLTYDLNSPLYNEVIRRQGLVYEISSEVIRIGKSEVVVIQCITTPGQELQVIKTIRKVMYNPEVYLKKQRFEVTRSSLKAGLQTDKITIANDIGKVVEIGDEDITNQFLNNITYRKVMLFYRENYKPNRWYVSIDKNLYKRKI